MRLKENPYITYIKELINLKEYSKFGLNFPKTSLDYLADYNIITEESLKEAYELIEQRKSKLPLKIRKIVIKEMVKRL